MQLLCMAIRTRSVLSHPPGMKPQRPLKPEIKSTPANAQLHLQHKFTAPNRTHQDIHSTQKYMQVKLLLFVLIKMPLYKGVPELRL
jgi:hypothetical protein